MTKEWYRDLEKRNLLQERLEKAGLPKYRGHSDCGYAPETHWNGTEH
jgi:hypothetical protein